MNRATRKTRFAKTTKHNARVRLAAKRNHSRTAHLHDKAVTAKINTQIARLEAMTKDEEVRFFDEV